MLRILHSIINSFIPHLFSQPVRRNSPNGRHQTRHWGNKGYVQAMGSLPATENRMDARTHDNTFFLGSALSLQTFSEGTFKIYSLWEIY